MKNIDTTMRIRLWFETDSQMLFGLGRVLLLKKVDECGSLYKAAKEIGMSYRAAWGKIKATEKLNSASDCSRKLRVKSGTACPKTAGFCWIILMLGAATSRRWRFKRPGISFPGKSANSIQKK